MNKVMLIGNVGKDPDIHYFEADQAVAQVSLATTEKGYTLPNGTQVPDHTDWHNLVFYRGLAKVVVTAFMWKEESATAPMMTSRVEDNILQKSM